VQEMQLNCDKGLKHMACEAPLLGPMAELWLVVYFLFFDSFHLMIEQVSN
jgi:hypothetical protein